jgi:hypothetical protein
MLGTIVHNFILLPNAGALGRIWDYATVLSTTPEEWFLGSLAE